MARRIVHQLVDDLDGTLLEPGAGETVLFSIDGVAYEIDLTDAHAEAFRSSFAPYTDAARRVSSGRPAAAAAPRRRASQTDYAPIRAWAAENGHQISDRGRVPASIIEAYEAAH